MYTLTRQVGPWRALSAEAPSAFVSMLIAEWFYKFGSFTLECIAFFATWYVASFVLAKVRGAAVRA